ncbi:hypothetical protein A3C86_01835 [Candidatus Kaiserbacteria bacterium RIFCSPHIGHO2_02_FULL_49_16]|uniref:Uncharacterized protein n=1 Tax=Candidatus Kaiserbacteria bacterium RIFCSPHIGHO2_02_FULL_49_16 TaxID=1798490 RepID=A0A1F6DE13_9BACT|nr:MAG: hypothetical protein A3C86_01835 [Candidatus Kaiserbacteria bacterium RIFCSPHIGHO2_02_FULL_49_16]
MKNTRVRKSTFVLQDIAIILLSILLAVILIKTNILVSILTISQERELLGSFIAGMFFTSIFTTVPAIVTLGEIANANSILLTALFGAMGAVLGDLIIFRFIRDRFSEHLTEVFKQRLAGRKVNALLHFRFFRWFSFVVGALIIASPLPDELGISLLGFAKMKMLWFIPLSFAFNGLGILLIGAIAKTL